MPGRRDSLLVALPRRRRRHRSWDQNYGQRGRPSFADGPACMWAVEGARLGARRLSGQKGREGLAKQGPIGCPAYRKREGKLKLVGTGMRERGPGSPAACVPAPDASPGEVFLPPAHLGPAVRPRSLLGTEVQGHTLHRACELTSPRKVHQCPGAFLQALPAQA